MLLLMLFSIWTPFHRWWSFIWVPSMKSFLFLKALHVLMSDRPLILAPAIPHIFFMFSIKHYLGLLQLTLETCLPLVTGPPQLLEVGRPHTIYFNHHNKNNIYMMPHYLSNAFTSIILFALNSISLKYILLSSLILWMKKLQLREI